MKFRRQYIFLAIQDQNNDVKLRCCGIRIFPLALVRTFGELLPIKASWTDAVSIVRLKPWIWVAMLLSSSDKQNRSTNPIQVAPGPYRHWYWPRLGALDWESQGSLKEHQRITREQDNKGQMSAWKQTLGLLSKGQVPSYGYGAVLIENRVSQKDLK